MLKAVVCLSIFLAVVRAEDAFITKGQWLLDSTEQCDGEYDAKAFIVRFRVSRGVDGLNGSIVVPFDIPVTYKIQVKVQKKTNGGQKDFQIINNNSFIRFLRDNSGANFDRIMEHMNLSYTDPDPIPKLPEEGIVGEYRAEVYLMDESTAIMGCLVVYATFTEDEDVCKTEEED